MSFLEENPHLKGWLQAWLDSIVGAVITGFVAFLLSWVFYGDFWKVWVVLMIIDTQVGVNSVGQGVEMLHKREALEET